MTIPSLHEKIEERRDLSELSILEHLNELRTRLINVIISVIVLGFCSYYFSESIFLWLSAPFNEAFKNHQLIGTGPAEALTLKITVSMFTGALVACPYIFYQIWKFISPGLHAHEKRLVLPFVSITTFCFLSGVFFCYYFVLPYSFAFFAGQYDSVNLAPQVKMSEHLELTLQILAGFGVVFELPVLSFCLARLGILTYKAVLGAVRYIIVGIFIFAAIFTPPDVISQMLMVIPMMILFGISILIVKLAERPRVNKD